MPMHRPQPTANLCMQGYEGFVIARMRGQQPSKVAVAALQIFRNLQINIHSGRCAYLSLLIKTAVKCTTMY